MNKNRIIGACVLVTMLFFVIASAGCVNTSDNKKTEKGGKWSAYMFEETVTPKTGTSGKIKTFKYDEKYINDNKVTELDVLGTYLGKVTEPIYTNRTEMTTNTYQVNFSHVSTNLECYKVKHDITVKRDDTNSGYANESSITVWIPTSGFNTSATYFWIYPKAEYSDEKGNSGSWSYYLTTQMQDEMNNPPEGKMIYYTPVVTGSDYIDDACSLALWGMYGWGWYWFHAYADGSSELKEGTVVHHYGTVSYTHIIKKVTKTI
ncbi:MAG: hypothetical protein QXT63_04800, partial [Thermoplasmata archaeon]